MNRVVDADLTIDRLFLIRFAERQPYVPPDRITEEQSAA